MATYNLNVTASVDLLGSDISGSQSTDFAIANPLPASSYFTFETVRNSDGFYDSSSPKNMAGTYTLGAGLAGIIKSDYIASVVVEPGGGTLTFVPTNYISGSSLNLRGTTSPPPAVVGAFSGLLDTYPGAAAAYSLRQLSSTYTGSAIRVRRASDNTEQDIGFSNNELDTTTLASFCSGTDGFVTTWYDQSGNGYNFTQTTSAAQPQIVSSGLVITENGKPKIQGGNSKALNLSLLLTGGYKIYSVQKVESNCVFIGSDNTSDYFLIGQSGSTSTVMYGNASGVSIRKNGSAYTLTNRGAFYTDFGTQNITSSEVTLGFVGSYLRLGYGNYGVFPMLTQQELVFYASTSTHAASDIENNLNNYYGIY